MPELARRGQGRKQKSDGDGNFFHWELLFLSIWIYAPRRFVYTIEILRCPNNLCGRRSLDVLLSSVNAQSRENDQGCPPARTWPRVRGRTTRQIPQCPECSWRNR